MFFFKFLYDLSFRSATETGTTPEIVFTFAVDHWLKLHPKLTNHIQRTQDFKKTYCKNEFVTFAFGDNKDIFDESAFGYNNCGYIIHNEKTTNIHLRILPDIVPCLTLTIHTLTACLLPDENIDTGTCPIYTIGINTLVGDSHGVGGMISSTIIDWLQIYYINNATPSKDSWSILVPQTVTAAMCEVKTLLTYGLKPSGSVSAQGRFLLTNIEDACDLGIYHDVSMECEDGYANIGSHNLNNAIQQLTLLAGLAKLCDLARAKV